MKKGCEDQKEKKTRSIQLPILENPPPQENEIRASGRSRWRALSLLAINLLMIAHFIQWRLMGTTISPIEPSESMYTLQSGAINAGFIFFTLAILATLIFGRFVCGWGCHVLALQDFCAWILKKFGLKPRPFRSRLLIFVPLVAALYMFVWPSLLRFFARPKNEPLIPQFSNHLITENFWATFPPVAVAIPFLFICGFVTVYFLGQKGFCTYACPYGGFFSLADKFSLGKIRVTDACNQCGHCTATCTSNVLVHAEVKQYGMVVDPGCMKCMDCVSVCPNDALYFGFGKPAVTVQELIKKNYSLTWFEEIIGAVVFLASFLAVWDVYQLVPMLMALGIAAITMFLSIGILKFLRREEMTFYRFFLKTPKRIRKAGWVFLSFGLLWIGLNAHSGWIHFHESAGTSAFQNLQIPDELALASANPDEWLNASDRKNIAKGKNHFRLATDYGLFANGAALPKLAWFEFLSGDAKSSVERLALAAEHQQGESKAISLYYRGALLNRMGRYEEAFLSLDAALTERDDLILAREEKGESLWQLGRRQEAIKTWKDAVRRNPNLVLANYQLAGAFELSGTPDDAAAYAKTAEQLTPADPLFHWMIGMRLRNLGMHALAQKHFRQAIELDPKFRSRSN